MKCDETYPECDRCTQTGRRCDGPTPRFKNFSITTSLQRDVALKEQVSAHPALLSSRPLENPRGLLQTPPEALRPTQSVSFLSLSHQPHEERRAFSFFINVAAPQISGSHDVYLWGHLVPQIAHQSRAVWNAVISIAQLWEYPFKDSRSLELNPNNLSNHQIQALEWYDRAICMQKITSGKVNDITSVLACTLFASIELQKSNYVNGFTMIRLGFAMIVSFLVGNDNKYCSPLESALVHQYMRSACLMLTSKLDSDIDPSSFSDLAGAKAALIQLMYSLYGLIKETYYAIKDQTFSAVHLTRRDSVLTRAILQIESRLKQVAETREGQMDDPSGVQYLYDYINALSLWSDGIRDVVSTSTSEDRFFSKIVDKAQEIITCLATGGGLTRIHPTFFNDMILLPPLYFTATMSDNSNIRSRALNLMSHHTSQVHPEQLHGIVAIDDPTSCDGNSVLLQRFHNCWDEQGKRTRVDTYTRIVVRV